MRSNCLSHFQIDGRTQIVRVGSVSSGYFFWVLLEQHTDKFQISEFQNCFKPKKITTQCTLSMLETRNHFQQKKKQTLIIMFCKVF